MEINFSIQYHLLLDKNIVNLAEDGSESLTAAAGKNRGLKDEKVTVAIICRSYKFKKQALFNRAQQQRNIGNSVTTIIQTPLTV